MNKLIGTAAALVAALVITSASAGAHPGHAHTVMGTIASASAARVEVVDKANAKTVVAITAGTKILVGKATGTAKDLVAGSRIVVEAREEADKTFIALTIQLPARAAQ